MKKSIRLLFLLLTSASIWAQTGSKPAEPSDSRVGGPSAAIDRAPPPDAVVLFDGIKLDAWTGDQNGTPGWSVQNGALTGQPDNGSLSTRQSFADCQLHLESSDSADSAVLLQGRYLVVLGPASPNWNSCDIIFRAPRFNNDGSLKSPAFVTVLHNGVLVQDHAELAGSLAFQGRPGYEKHFFKQPLVIPAPKNPVSFRNIWIRELGVEQLLNGKDATGWYSYLEKLGKNNDPEGNFKIVDGMLHIEGKNFGYFATEKTYANYYLKAVFKWGQHQYAPRATGKRDSGILYHLGTDIPDKIWPKSLECQIQEGDCGDYWCVDGSYIDSPNHAAIEWNQKRIYRTADFELPNTEWNTVEIICNGSQSEHYVNGHLVNSGTNSTVSSGKILLQSEGAEIYYRTVELIPY